MIKTNAFVKSLLEKELVDDVAFLANGYDIQVDGKIVSVRVNEKGRAIIWNHNSSSITEVDSGRLDDVLHKFIIASCFGFQSKEGVHSIKCSNTFFVPVKLIKNNVVFADTLGREFVVSNTTKDAILSFFNEAAQVNADDCILMLDGFQKYDRHITSAKESVDENEVNVNLLKCSVSIDDYAVSPISSSINDVGKTVVGNFICSSSDKLNYMTFEDDLKNIGFGKSRSNVTSSTIRSDNVFVKRAKVALNSSKGIKSVKEYLNAKYPAGLSVRAVESAMAYEAPSIFKHAGITDALSYKNLFNNYRVKADCITFRLDSNMAICSSIEKSGESIQTFRAVPDVEVIANALHREGYTLDELESGLTFEARSDIATSITNAMKNIVPLAEKVINSPNVVTKLVGSSVKDELKTFGISDDTGAFMCMNKVIIN